MIQQPGNTDLTSEPISGVMRNSFWRIMGAIAEYHTELGYPKTKCTDSEKNAQHRQFCLAIHAEVTELLDAVPWKPWRPEGYKEPDILNIKEEVVDIVFFLTSICEVWGIDFADLGDMLERKLIENRRRVLNGYSKPAAEM